jgi:penicillin-binding protein 2
MMHGRTGDDASIRGRIFMVVTTLVIGLLLLRLVKLQILDAGVYSGESRSNAVRELRVTPARGNILDREGRLIVDNEDTYTVLLTPRYFDPERTGLLASLLSVPDSVVVRKLAEARAWSPFRPSPAFRSVSFDVIGRLLEHRRRLPGVTYEAAQKRRYVAPFRASHVLGYVREITRAELDRRTDAGYRSGDLVGKSGVESSFERALRGTMGSAFRLVNVHGQEVDAFRGGAEDLAPVGGEDVVLTIDYDLQALAESLFVGKRGAVVALDPNNGEILALLSTPDFDPDLMSRPLSPEAWNYLVSSRDRPQFNRATQSLLPPGSTWKPMVALMALQEGAITPRSTVTCNGGHPIGRGRFFRCMHVHGTITVETAIEKSCNTFFLEMMTRVDVNSFARYARTMGFGRRAPLDVGEEDTGVIPDSAYLDRRYPGWTIGTPMNLGIGQGDMGVTPLQLAEFMGAVGNGEWLYTPHLVRALRGPDGTETKPDLPPPVRLPFDREHVDLVRGALRKVMEGGTGRWIQIPGIPSAGKTGTAQNNRGQDDSVFIMFAPYDEPRIALGVMVENAGFGSTTAGPIASLLAERYLTKRIAPERRPLFERTLAMTSGPLPE